MTKVLVVGSNPSTKSPDNSAFHASTRSRTVIDSWFHGMIVDISYMNLIDEKRPGNSALKRSEIISIIPLVNLRLNEFPKNIKIVTVGKSAELAMTLLRVNHFAMPHPSGLNRQLNDKTWTAEKIKKLAEFISEL